MARKRPKVNLSQPAKPRSGDLENLFATDSDSESASGLQLVSLRLDAIEPDPDQPRHTFPPDSLAELADSIRQDGVIQPIEVTELGRGRYMLVHGERRWRAAEIAGLDSIPAVVRRRNYDTVTRFVRQIVENIQREDLNDVDRAAGMLRLRDLMQEELDQAQAEGIANDEPWGTRVTWAKVGNRLGMSRQRIHQLIQLLNLPDEIKESVRDGELSERDTRIYQGLTQTQQRALHRARVAGDVSQTEARKISRFLKDAPDKTVAQAMRVMLEPLPSPEPTFDPSEATEPDASISAETPADPPAPTSSTAARAATAVDRLMYVRHHLNRIQLKGLSAEENQEVVRQLRLIEQDIASLIDSLS